MYRNSSYSQLPEVVKNLLIINGLLFLAKITLGNKDISLISVLGLHHHTSGNFEPYQLITHMFMHANPTHLLTNMFALWMFGKVLENVWGAKRFLIYYMLTGFGAAALHYTVISYQLSPLLNYLPDNIIELAKEGRYIQQHLESKELASLLAPTVGASGAVFGILLAFGILFPNTQLFLLFPPIPIKAKYFVIIYGGIELYLGLMNKPGDNVAHFAHLGGMIFGFLMIKYWQRHNTFY